MTVDELGDQYCLVGPYDENSVKTEVEVMEPSNSGQTRSNQVTNTRSLTPR